MEGDWEPCESEPDSAPEINNESLDKELAGSSVEEVEEPLLSGIGSVMPDISSAVSSLLIEILFSVPSSIHGLGHSETLTVHNPHVLHVSELVVSQSSSYTQ